MPWYPFEHPQLGSVEIGGWDDLFVWRNPPRSFLEAELAKVNGFILAQASMAAHLRVHSVDVTPVAAGQVKIALVLENTGYLPTYTSQRAQERKAVKPITVDLELPEGAVLIHGKRQTEIGQLEGRSNKFTVGGLGESPTDNRARLEWIVQAQPGQRIRIVARSERAGTARQEIIVGDARSV